MELQGPQPGLSTTVPPEVLSKISLVWKLCSFMTKEMCSFDITLSVKAGDTDGYMHIYW